MLNFIKSLIPAPGSNSSDLLLLGVNYRADRVSDSQYISMVRE
jgi:hypothetical protein